MKIRPARRVFERPGKPIVHGPWHALQPNARTLCHQSMHGAPGFLPLEYSKGSRPPASGKLCTKCWDRVVEPPQRPGRRGGIA